MERIWLKQYPPGMPTEIDASQYPSLVTLLEESFAKYSDRKAFICMDKAITYGELDTMSRDFAAYLQGTGLKFGDRVALMMPNVLQYPVATAGVLRAGMTVVNVNPLYTPRELEHQLNDSGAEAIVILENFATTLEKVVKNTRVKHIILANMGDMLGFPKGVIVNLVVRKVKKMVPAYSLPSAVQFKAAVAAGKGKPLNTRTIAADDVAFLPGEVVMIFEIEKHLRTEVRGEMFMDKGVVCRGVASHEVHRGPVFLAVGVIEGKPRQVLQFLG